MSAYETEYSVQAHTICRIGVSRHRQDWPSSPTNKGAFACATSFEDRASMASAALQIYPPRRTSRFCHTKISANNAERLLLSNSEDYMNTMVHREGIHGAEGDETYSRVLEGLKRRESYRMETGVRSAVHVRR